MVIRLVPDEEYSFTLEEVCRIQGVSTALVVEMVDEGILEPVGRGPGDWRFPGRMLPRLRLALRIRQDLGVNLAGAALAVDLLEEVRSLRRRVTLLEEILGE